MYKIIKIIGSILTVLLLLYAVSFFFSNVGLGPSSSSKLTGTEQVPIGSSTSFSMKEQEIPEMKAGSYLVVDLSTDQILHSKRVDSSLLVASLTKLMTARTVLEYGSLTDKYTIKQQDTKAFNPALGLVVGDRVLVSDLMNAMLIGSANDAAISLSHYIEEKQSKSFAELMNQEAINLTMRDTRFSNPNGFDSETNYSSSNDLRILATKLYTQKVFDNTSRATGYNFSGEQKIPYQINATNTLIRNYSDLYAIKTGFTEEAQGSMINILKFNNKDYLLIVLNSPDREGDTLILRDKVKDSNN